MTTGTSDNQIEVALTADISSLQAGMTAAQTTVKTAIDSLGASAQQGMRDFGVLDDILNKNIKTLEQLGQAENALTRLQRDGLISTEELDKAFKILDATEAKLAKSSEEAAGAVDKVTKAGHGAGAMTAGVTRELGVLANEIASGNWHRLEGSLIVMANRMNLMQYAFSAAGLAVVGSAAAVGTLIGAYESAEHREHEFLQLTVATGGALGVTRTQFEEMAQSMAGNGHTIADAEGVLHKLGMTGKFSGEQLHIAGQAALDMATVTGQSLDECVHSITRLRDDPVRAVLALNEQYGFLTAAQYEEIEALDEQGRHMDAAKLATDLWADEMHKRAGEVGADADYLTQKFRGLIATIQGAWRAAGDTLRQMIDGQNEADKIADLDRRISDLKGAWKGLNDAKTAATSNAAPAVELRTLEAQRKALVDAVQARADAAAKQAQQNKDAVAAVADQEAFNKKLSDGISLQDKIAEAKKRAELIHKTDPGSASIKGIKFDASGAVAGGEQWDATVKKLTAEYDKVGVAADKAAERAAKAAERAAKAAAKHAEHGALQQAQFREKDAEQLRKEIAEEDDLRRSQVDGDKRVNDMRLKNDRDAAVNAAQARKATADEILRIEIDADAKQLDADRAYYAQRIALDKGNVKLLQTDENVWEQAQQKARAADLAAWRRYYAEINREAQKSGHTIATTIGSALKGVLVQGQSFRQVMGNVFTSVAEKAIDKAMETLFVHQTVETAKTTSTVVGNATRTASDVASTQTSMALTSQKGIQSILTSGAEVIGRVWSSIAAIPYVGPFLAPAMAIAAGAAVYKLAGSIPSASGGWDRVPSDTIAQIHKDEMVLPAELAQGVRDMTGKGKGGGKGDTHIHLATLDMKSAYAALRRNPHALAGAVKYASRMGHFGGGSTR